jgi:serine/threonine protein kinase
MQNLVPPFVWSLKYSTPVSVKNDVGICFEEYFQYFGINPEEDCSEYGLLQRATERRKSFLALLKKAADIDNTTPAEETSETLLVQLNDYLDSLQEMFGFLSDCTTNTISSTSSTSSSFSVSSLSGSDSELNSIVPKRPGVAWTSTLSSTDDQSWAGDLSLELVAVLANKAVALIRLATNGTERMTKPMCLHLREAAGIYDWLGSAQLNARGDMPEASPQVVFALSAALQGTLQQIAIGVAMGNTEMASKHVFLGSLCIGVAELFSQALSTLRSSSVAVDDKHKRIRIALACWPVVWRTLAFEQMANRDKQLRETGNETQRSSYVSLLQVASSELDQIPYLDKCSDETLVQCIRSEQKRIHSIINQSRNGQSIPNFDAFDTANILPKPKYLPFAKPTKYDPRAFQSKFLTGLGAFSLETLKTAAEAAVQMDNKGKYTNAYKYYEIVVSMICIALWHQPAWYACMGTENVEERVRNAWHERVVGYRTRQSEILSFIAGGNHSGGGNDNGHSSVSIKLTASDPTKKVPKKVMLKGGKAVLNVPANLRTFIEVPGEEQDDMLDGFSELRLSEDYSNNSNNNTRNEYPKIHSKETKGTSEWKVEEMATQPTNKRGKNESGGNDSLVQSAFPMRMNVGQPKVVSSDTFCLTIEWEILLTKPSATTEIDIDTNKQTNNNVNDIMMAATAAATALAKKSTTPSHDDSNKSISSVNSNDNSKNGSNSSRSNFGNSSKKEIKKVRKRSNTEPVPSLSQNSTQSQHFGARKSIPVFQVAWRVNKDMSWHIEPTLIVPKASGTATNGQYTKENLAHGEYQFRVRLYQPVGKDELPWSEPSQPYKFGATLDSGVGSCSDDTDENEFKDDSPNETIDSNGKGDNYVISSAAALRAPSVDDYGNLLEKIDSDEIKYDDPLVILGQGGFGIVSRSAVNGFRGRTVAVKRVKPREPSGLQNTSDSERAEIRDELLADMLKELYAESAILAKLSHQSIVSVLAINLNKESPFLVMEYCDAGTLKDLLHPNRRLSKGSKGSSNKLTTPAIKCALGLKQRLILAEQVISAVNYLHANFVIHRDLKPANVLLTTVAAETTGKTETKDTNSKKPTFIAKLTDFGLSRTRQRNCAGLDTVLGGSYPFLAPEAFRSTPITQSVDVYSFGIMLHEIITLDKPWHGYEPFQITVAVAVEGKRPHIPATRKVPNSIWSVVRSCWAQEVDKRPEAVEVRESLRSALNELGDQ